MSETDNSMQSGFVYFIVDKDSAPQQRGRELPQPQEQHNFSGDFDVAYFSLSELPEELKSQLEPVSSLADTHGLCAPLYKFKGDLDQWETGIIPLTKDQGAGVDADHLRASAFETPLFTVAQAMELGVVDDTHLQEMPTDGMFRGVGIEEIISAVTEAELGRGVNMDECHSNRDHMPEPETTPEPSYKPLISRPGGQQI